MSVRSDDVPVVVVMGRRRVNALKTAHVPVGPSQGLETKGIFGQGVIFISTVSVPVPAGPGSQKESNLKYSMPVPVPVAPGHLKFT
jgi:hypothetical protein